MSGPRIQIYQPQVATPRVALEGGHLNAPEGVNLGESVGRLGGAIEHVVSERKESDAAAYTAKALAQAQADADRMFVQQQGQAKDGAAGFADSFGNWFKGYRAKLLEQAPTLNSKKYLAARLQALGTDYDQRALAFQTQEARQYRSDSFRQAADTVASELAVDDSRFGVRMAELNATIDADTDSLPDQKRATKDYARSTIAVAASYGRVQRDPYASLDQLGKRLGIPPGSNLDPVKRKFLGIFQRYEQETQRGDPNAQQHLQDAMSVAGPIPVGMEIRVQQMDWQPGTDAFSMLTIPQALQLYGMADSEIRRREAEAKQNSDAGKVTFAQKLRDAQVALMNGDVVDVPTVEQASQFMDPERATIEVRQLETLQSMAGEFTALKTATPAETQALLERYKPTGADNREARQQAYDLLARQAAQVAQDRTKDPGQFVLDNAPQVSAAYQQYAGLAAQGARTPQEAVALMQAQRRYLTLNQAEQERLGIDKPKLPDAFVHAVKKDFTSSLEHDPQGAVARLAQTGALLSSSPYALDQVAAAVGPDGVLAMEGVDAPTVQKLARLRAVPETDRKKLLPPGTTWSDLQGSVAKALAPLTRTFAAQNDNATATRYSEAATLLAFERIQAGESTTQAAQDAFQTLIGRRYTLADTYRIPNVYSAGRVQRGLALFLDRFDAGQLMVTPEPGFTPEESAVRKLRTIAGRARWVNNGTDTGVYLQGPDGNFALTRDGKPVFVPFEQAAALEPDHPAVRSQVMDRRAH